MSTPGPAPQPPEPPSPSGLMGMMKRAVKAGRPSSQPTNDQEARLRSGTRLDWTEFRDSKGQTPDNATIMGAGELLGERIAPTAVFGQVLAWGPYQYLAYEDPEGLVETTVSEYYSNQAGSYLTEEGFFDERYKSYHFDPTRGGKDASVSSVSKEPAPITLSPTSTTYPPRPRTVAAGWDSERKVLTVVFRDGTFYNYYGVNAGVWSNFVRARSKGRFIKVYLDGHMRGYADMGGIPLAHRELLYRVSRTAQIAKGGYTGRQRPGSRRGTGGRYGYGRTGTPVSGGRVYARAKAMARAAGAARYTSGPPS